MVQVFNLSAEKKDRRQRRKKEEEARREEFDGEHGGMRRQKRGKGSQEKKSCKTCNLSNLRGLFPTFSLSLLLSSPSILPMPAFLVPPANSIYLFVFQGLQASISSVICPPEQTRVRHAYTDTEDDSGKRAQHQNMSFSALFFSCLAVFPLFFSLSSLC